MGQWRHGREGRRAAPLPRVTALGAAALIAGAAMLAACSSSGSATERAADQATTPAPPTSWRMGWRSETVFGDTNPAPVTCRLAARLAAVGSSVRLEFGSPVGHRGYRLMGADLARATGPGSLAEVAGTRHPVTFSGETAVQVPPGGRVLSDPVGLNVRPGDLITVTLTVGPGDLPVKSAWTEPYSCAQGTAPLAAPASAFTLARSQAYLRTVLVGGPAQRSIVAIGDSLTENAQSSPIASYLRWTDALVGHGISVVNAGVSGGELTGLGYYGAFTGLQRLQQVLTEPGITDVVLALGTNDLAGHVSADALLNAYRTAASLVRNYGARIWIVTIPPRGDIRWSGAYEVQRKRLNSLFRNGFLTHIGARIIDLDAVVRDPLRAGVLNPVDDVGDHLHLSPPGEKEFAAAVASALGVQ